MLFYIIFGTNLLTQSLESVPVSVFSLFLSYTEKEYQTESKRNEINWRSYFWKETHLMDLDPTLGETRGAHKGGERPLSRGTPAAPPTSSPHPYIPT